MLLWEYVMVAGNGSPTLAGAILSSKPHPPLKSKMRA
jgi:hypothetical protein